MSVDFRVALRVAVRGSVEAMEGDQISDRFRRLWMTTFARCHDVGVTDALTDRAPAATVAEGGVAVRTIRLVPRPSLTAGQTSSTARADRGSGVHDGIAAWAIDQVFNVGRHSGPITRSCQRADRSQEFRCDHSQQKSGSRKGQLVASGFSGRVTA